jgi:hypothetical protein
MLIPGNIIYNKHYHYSALILQIEIDTQSKYMYVLTLLSNVDNTKFIVRTWSFDPSLILDYYIIL